MPAADGMVHVNSRPVSSARSKNFAIYGEPGLFVVALFTLIPTLVIAIRERAPDFSVFFASALALRHGIDPYQQALAEHTPNANPPAILFPFLALTWFPERVAFWIWTGSSMLALLVSLKAIGRALRLPLRPLLLAALGLQGVGVTLRYGQVSLWLLLLVTWAWLADRDDRKTAAGGWLGVLIYVKPFMGLYAVYLFWRREWRVVAALVVAYMLSVAVGLIAGVALTRSWIETLGGLTYRAPHVVNASWLGIVSRVFTVDRPQAHPTYTAWLAAPRLAMALWLIGVLAIGLISLRAIRRTPNRDSHWAIVGAATLLISPLGWTYYLPLLIPPLAAVIPRCRHLVLVIIAGVLLLVPSNVLALGTFGALATATVGSPYTWGLLLLWATLCADTDPKQLSCGPS